MIRHSRRSPLRSRAIGGRLGKRPFLGTQESQISVRELLIPGDMVNSFISFTAISVDNRYGCLGCQLKRTALVGIRMRQALTHPSEFRGLRTQTVGLIYHAYLGIDNDGGTTNCTFALSTQIVCLLSKRSA